MFLLLLYSNSTYCAPGCPTIPAQPTFNPATATALPSMAPYIAGAIYKLASNPQTISGDYTPANNNTVYIQAGEVLNIEGNFIQAGAIYILSGGTLNFTNATSTGVSNTGVIYVYGTMNVTAILALNNGSDVRVGSTGVVSGPIIKMNSSSVLVVEGAVKLTELQIVSNNTKTCINNNGCIRANDLTNSLGGGPSDVIQNGASSSGTVYISGSTCPSGSGLTSSPTKVCFAGAGPCTSFGTSTVTYNCSPSGACAITPLPVHLLNFNAVKSEKGVKCEWAINDSYDSKEFLIEKSQDGKNWILVSVVPVVNKSNSVQSYTITDSFAGSNIWYYRLSERSIYNELTALLISYLDLGDGQNDPIILIYPNPCQGELNIHISNNVEKAIVEVLNLEGKTLLNSKLKPGVNTFDLQLLTQGIYLAKIRYDRKVFSEKIVISFQE
ncbi:MAG: T9SS type A sorting domain-containing protein [Opitutaceae bacterium]|nr:T9SS type A sorting domain-containing protein [Cytophagales bacterium]